jgi:hypothetical protein
MEQLLLLARSDGETAVSPVATAAAAAC